MKYDSQLYVLRSCIRAITDKRSRHELEHMRFMLYRALDGDNREGAKRWSAALRAGMLAVPSGSIAHELFKAGETALAEIVEGLKN